jgi:Na+-driven multidrug efflux pump
MGDIFFKYISFSMPIFTSYMIYNNALIGAGKTVLTMIGDILRLWGIRIPIIAVLATTMGFKGIFVGMIISNLIVFFVTYAFFKFSNWKKAVV